MDIATALALKQRVENETLDIWNMARDGLSKYGPSWDLWVTEVPEHDTVHIVTKDGEKYSLLMFSGAYEQRSECTLESVEEWEQRASELREEITRLQRSRWT